MRYVSLFSGVEAASVAWGPLGWEPVAFAEVEEFPCAVLAHRFPDVPNLGDVTKIDWSEFHERYGAVDVLVGGSPCQSFSIAGNREGLAGESGLMFEYIRAVRELVHASGGGSPRYVLWENVPGALSSERGVAFGQLLAELDELGYGLAWRVLDAQYARVPDGSPSGFFGPVAQRRRRVFLVGVLGSPHAAEILFERSCLFGDHPKGGEAREALAEHLEGRAGVGDRAGFFYGIKADTTPKFSEDTSPTLRSHESGGGVNDIVCFTPWDVQSKRVYGTDNAGPTLPSGTGEGMNIQPCVLSVRTANTNTNGHGIAADVTHTLDGTNGQCVCMSSGQANAEVTDDGIAPTLTTIHEAPVVIDRAAFNQVRQGPQGGRDSVRRRGKDDMREAWMIRCDTTPKFSEGVAQTLLRGGKEERMTWSFTC